MRIKKVKICSTYYNVKYIKKIINNEGLRLLGDIDFRETIRIATDCPKQRQLQALLHESTHGVADEYQLKMDETFVILLSNAFYAFIIDNPKFIKEILKHTEKMRKES